MRKNHDDDDDDEGDHVVIDVPSVFYSLFLPLIKWPNMILDEHYLHHQVSLIVYGNNVKILLYRPIDPPMCQYEGKVIRAALKQTLNITCDIDSNPMVCTVIITNHL